VAQVGAEEVVLELLGIGEVPVMAKDDTERRIHVERLRLGGRPCRTGGGIARVSDTALPAERAHVARAEHVAHHARSLVRMEVGAVRGDDARRILAAMLEDQQPVVQKLIDGVGRDYTEDSAHRKSQS
jgi:hypothetical protein